MIACPPYVPDRWSLPLLALPFAVALHQTWRAVRAIRLRRFETYRDARLDPTGGKAIAIAVLALAVGWGTSVFVAWLNICSR